MSNVTSQARSSLFRGEAFEYHFREQESRGVLNTSTRHPWSIALASLVLLSVALTYTLVAQVEVVYRAEGAMKPRSVQGSPGGEQLVIAYVRGASELQVKLGAHVRLEFLRPVGGRSRFIDGRLTALARAPMRLDIALDHPVEAQVSEAGGTLIPIRIHAVGCRKSLWRLALSPTSGCLER